MGIDCNSCVSECKHNCKTCQFPLLFLSRMLAKAYLCGAIDRAPPLSAQQKTARPAYTLHTMLINN